MHNPNFIETKCQHETPHRMCIDCGKRVGGTIEYVTLMAGGSYLEGYKMCLGDVCFKCHGYYQ